MKSSISTLTSFIFMASLVTLAISAFAVVIIIVRHFFTGISENEIGIGYKFFTIFVIAGIIAPISLYINLKCDRIEKLEDEERF